MQLYVPVRCTTPCVSMSASLVDVQDDVRSITDVEPQRAAARAEEVEDHDVVRGARRQSLAVTKNGPHDTVVNAPGVPVAMRTPAE